MMALYLAAGVAATIGVCYAGAYFIAWLVS